MNEILAIIFYVLNTEAIVSNELGQKVDIELNDEEAQFI